MRKQAYSILVHNTPGLLNRMSGLFSRRGYNIESITAGATSDPQITRITIVASGDEEILAQIRQGQIPDHVQKQDDHSYRYICPISDNQALYVHVMIHDTTWDVLQWRVITAEQAETDELLSLWDGSI